MQKRLLVVEDVYSWPRAGVIVGPFVPFDALPRPEHMPIRRIVTLRRPEGASQQVAALFVVPTCIPPDRLGHDCLLQGIKKAAVPVGTEIWIDA
jgi:hypothetical protein